MKFVVDDLPYYGDDCPLMLSEWCKSSYESICPRFWDKEFVCSDENPHECPWLKEIVNE